MGSKSLLKVAGNLLARNFNSGGYGFRGEGDDYAVIQAGSISKESEGQYRAAYYGNLFIDTDDHFAQGGTAAQPWYYFEPSVKFSFTDKNNNELGAKKVTNFSITIPADAKGCTPGYSYTTGPKPVTESIRVIGEDLTVNQRSDYDFNDIVFDVFWTHTPGIAENQTVKIIVRAAGGELPIYIGNDDNALEIHDLFYAANPTRNITVKTMMNTYQGQHESYTCPEVLLEDNWWSGDNIQDIANSIMIRVQKSGTQFVLKAPRGEVPSKIAVDTDFVWCDERQDIDAKYFGEDDKRFTKYVGGQYEWNTWYKK